MMLRVNTLAVRDAADAQSFLAPLSEKARLPTIIVTPSSPSSQADYQVHYFAFPDPNEKAPILARLFPSSRHARAVLFILLLAIVIILHFVMARYAEAAADEAHSYFGLSFWSNGDVPAAAASLIPNEFHRPAL